MFEWINAIWFWILKVCHCTGFDDETLELLKPLKKIESWVAKNAVICHAEHEYKFHENKYFWLEYNPSSRKMCIKIHGITRVGTADEDVNFRRYYIGNELNVMDSVNVNNNLYYLVKYWDEVKEILIRRNACFSNLDEVKNLVSSFKV